MTVQYDPNQHHRRSIRLKGYDYRLPGAYFVTLCTRERKCVMDDPVVRGIITDVWYALPRWFPTIALDEFVVMPNHVHLIVWLHGHDGVGATLAVAPNVVVPDVGGGGARASLAPTGVGDAVAPNVVIPDGVGGARASLAPTGVGDAVAPNVVIPDGVGGARASLAPTGADWVVPDPETVNVNPTLGDVMGAFKSLVFTVYLDWIQAHDPTRRAKFWQRNYFEHVIRNERELLAIRQYIYDNPAQWALDRDNPDNLRRLSPPTRIEDYLADIQALLENMSGE